MARPRTRHRLSACAAWDFVQNATIQPVVAKTPVRGPVRAGATGCHKAIAAKWRPRPQPCRPGGGRLRQTDVPEQGLEVPGRPVRTVSRGAPAGFAQRPPTAARRAGKTTSRSRSPKGPSHDRERLANVVRLRIFYAEPFHLQLDMVRSIGNNTSELIVLPESWQVLPAKCFGSQQSSDAVRWTKGLLLADRKILGREGIRWGVFGLRESRVIRPLGR